MTLIMQPPACSNLRQVEIDRVAPVDSQDRTVRTPVCPTGVQPKVRNLARASSPLPAFPPADTGCCHLRGF